MRVIIFLLFTIMAFAQDDVTLGKNALNEKKYDDAIQYFQKALIGKSRDVETNYLLGETYRQKGEFSNALEMLEKTLDYDDEYEPALVAIIRVYGKLQMWDKAAKRFKEVEKYHKKSTLAPIAYAQTFLETDSLDKASIYFSKAKELDANNVEVYIGLAEVYARQNVIVLAESNLRTATQIKPNDPTLWYRLATTILKNRGLNASQIQEIIAALKKSIELDPTNDKAIFDAANTLYRTKVYWKESAEFFRSYVELKKDNAEAWEKYAISAYNAKAYADAIPVLEQAIKMNPGINELKLMLAHSYYLAKEYTKSLDLYKKFSIDSLATEEVYRMGDSYFRLKDSLNAIKYLELTLTRDNENSDAIGTLAALFLNQKRYEKAAQQYERLIAKDPRNITALFYAAFSYYVLGKPDTAKGYYKQLVALRPNNVQSHQSLAQIYSLQDSIAQGRYHSQILISLSDSLIKADPSKIAQHSQTAITGYRMLALFDWKEKNVRGALEKLERAIGYEKEKKDPALHLFIAQMYAVASGEKELTDDEAKVLRDKACKEYLLVLKLDPKNAAAKKESTQMNCGK